MPTTCVSFLPENLGARIAPNALGCCSDRRRSASGAGRCGAPGADRIGLSTNDRLARAKRHYRGTGGRDRADITHQVHGNYPEMSATSWSTPPN
jgi:hypothetical protein